MASDLYAQDRENSSATEGNIRQGQGIGLQQCDASADCKATTNDVAGTSEPMSETLRAEASGGAADAFGTALLQGRLNSMLADAEGCPKASGEGPAVQVITVGGACLIVKTTEGFFTDKGEKWLRANCGGLLAKDESFGFLATDLIHGMLPSREKAIPLGEKIRKENAKVKKWEKEQKAKISKLPANQRELANRKFARDLAERHAQPCDELPIPTAASCAAVQRVQEKPSTQPRPKPEPELKQEPQPPAVHEADPVSDPVQVAQAALDAALVASIDAMQAEAHADRVLEICISELERAQNRLARLEVEYPASDFDGEFHALTKKQREQREVHRELYRSAHMSLREASHEHQAAEFELQMAVKLTAHVQRREAWAREDLESAMKRADLLLEVEREKATRDELHARLHSAQTRWARDYSDAEIGAMQIAHAKATGKYHDFTLGIYYPPSTFTAALAPE